MDINESLIDIRYKQSDDNNQHDLRTRKYSFCLLIKYFVIIKPYETYIFDQFVKVLFRVNAMSDLLF